MLVGLRYGMVILSFELIKCMTRVCYDKYGRRGGVSQGMFVLRLITHIAYAFKDT